MGIWDNFRNPRNARFSPVSDSDGEFIDVAEELRNPGYAIPEVDTSAFLDHILPPLKDGVDLESIICSLKREGTIGRSRRWKGFGTGRRRRAKRAQRSAFAPLVDIFERVTSLATAEAPHLKQIVEMTLVPKRRRKSGRRVLLPGGYFLLKDEEKATSAWKGGKREARSWFDVALVAEFWGANSEEPRETTSTKAISNIQSILSRDPCRRFTFGITVEDTDMRLWFYPRGTPVVSKAFDFTKEVRILTHVFLSLAFASKEELGWDASIRPFDSGNGGRKYHIDVGDETYETVQMLSQSSAEKLDSHATRVWKVKRRGSEEPFVLKDVWVDDDQRLEHAIHGMILHDVEEKYGTDIREKVASHLLTPVAHWLVPANGEEDHTTRVMMRGYSASFRHRFKVNVEELRFPDDEGSEVPSSSCIVRPGAGGSTLRAPLPWYNPRRKVAQRKHYRVVFKEFAKPLHWIKNLDGVFAVLSDSAKVLKWIHGCGWVHRDLSVGNLYLYDGRGLIGDLEYAKLKNSDVTREFKTGTLDFMAVEAVERNYSYRPKVTIEQFHLERKALCEGRGQEVELMRESRRPPPFFHNDLHDLESLWWIAVWELFTYHIVSDAGIAYPRTPAEDLRRDHAFAELFPGTDETRNRKLFLHSEDAYNYQVAWMPDRLRNIWFILNTSREMLVNKYVEFETGFSAVRMDIFEGAHDEFRRLFEKCRRDGHSIRLSLYRKSDQAIRPSRCQDAGQAMSALPDRLIPKVIDVEQSTSPDVKVVSEKKAEARRYPDASHSGRSGKRKRENDDEDFLPMPPLRLRRCQLEVFQTN